MLQNLTKPGYIIWGAQRKVKIKACSTQSPKPDRGPFRGRTPVEPAHAFTLTAGSNVSVKTPWLPVTCDLELLSWPTSSREEYWVKWEVGNISDPQTDLSGFQLTGFFLVEHLVGGGRVRLG